MKKETESRKGLLIALFIAFIMITSVVGFMWGNTSNRQVEYKGRLFDVKQDGIYTKIDKNYVRFNTLPSEVENIKLEPSIINRIKSTKMVYATYNADSENSEAIATAVFDLQEQLNKLFFVYVQPSFTKETEYNLPFVTCSNATQYIPVLYFLDSNTTEIMLENNCVLLKAKSGLDFIKLKDRLIYALVGIIQ